MDHPEPHAWIGLVVLGRDAEDPLDLRVHVGRGLAVIRVHDRGDLLDEAPVSSVDVGESDLGLSTGDERPSITNRDDRLVGRHTSDADLDGKVMPGPPPQGRVEGNLALDAVPPVGHHILDVVPDGIPAQEQHHPLVRDLDPVVTQREQRLGGGREQASRIEVSGDRGPVGFLHFQETSAGSGGTLSRQGQVMPRVTWAR